ncbi:hypothetical protein AVEN_261046-1 [Araneus ventricosus]|uniref:Uncharacterized protein n=2 Tax=Araneus ventricosus TaxID=182803 RepID=A0A4Y2G1W9_ARAVE|nr:hypothetical protein AVEN_261046-1 [Araneus ventricosus]
MAPKGLLHWYASHVKHGSFLKSRKDNFALPGSGDSKTKRNEIPYGLHPMFAACRPVAEVNLPQTSTPLSDRIVNYEAMLLGFLAEKSLPYSLAPDLLHLVKEMAKDEKALNQVTMHRTAASYKMRFGVSKTMKEGLLEDLGREFFSLNEDESTSSNNQRVVTVLVNYLNKGRKIVTKHLSSYSVDKVNSEAIFQGIVKIFVENDIPWKNLMSVLLDSCNRMRGKNSGLEVKIRTQCPHLLDIDGDSCHHVHNAAKQFSIPFEMHVESLCTDIHNDLKWSPDMRAIFSEVCSALKVKCTMPQTFISFRWLSVYDAAQDLLRLLGALTVFYYSFLCTSEKSQFLHILISIYKASDVSNAAREHIRHLQRTLSDKALTQVGQDRKNRIVKKLFNCCLETQLVSNLFVSVLSLLKEYLKLFQSGVPLIHILHDKQFSLVKDFLACFIKAETIASLSGSSKKIKLFDVQDRDSHLPTKSVFVGENVKKLYASVPRLRLCKNSRKMF